LPVSFLLCLEHVEHWERIASRGRPAFSSHLVSPVHGIWPRAPEKPVITDDPVYRDRSEWFGYVVYEDEYLIVAEPFAGERY
jgi:hypothetical protein